MRRPFNFLIPFDLALCLTLFVIAGSFVGGIVFADSGGGLCLDTNDTLLREVDANHNGLIDDNEIYLAAFNADTYSENQLRAITAAWVTQCQIPAGSTTQPPAVAQSMRPSKDLDGDGIYEDVNGNGVFNAADCQLLAQGIGTNQVMNDNVAAFNFDGEGNLTFADVTRCYAMVAQAKSGGAGSVPVGPSSKSNPGVGMTLKRLANPVGAVEASLQEAPDNSSCTINWGDGADKQSVSPAAGVHTLKHAYTQSGNYTVTYSCAAAGGPTYTRSVGISVDVTSAPSRPDTPARGSQGTYTVLIVPFNYTSDSAITNDANRVVAALEQDSPIAGESLRVNSVIAGELSLKCAPTGDKRICYKQLARLWGSAPDAGYINLTVGMCAPGTCFSGLGKDSRGQCHMDGTAEVGITYNVGGRITIADMFSCVDSAGYIIGGTNTLLHEVGHAWGLSHISGCGYPENLCANGASKCNQTARSFCISPNASDCTAADHEHNYMGYCVHDLNTYGSAGTHYIKSQLPLQGRPDI